MSLKVHLSHTLEHTHADIIPAATYFVNHCGIHESVVERCAYWGISFFMRFQTEIQNTHQTRPTIYFTGIRRAENYAVNHCGFNYLVVELSVLFT